MRVVRSALTSRAKCLGVLFLNSPLCAVSRDGFEYCATLFRLGVSLCRAAGVFLYMGLLHVKCPVADASVTFTCTNAASVSSHRFSLRGIKDQLIFLPLQWDPRYPISLRTGYLFLLSLFQNPIEIEFTLL